MLSLKTEPRMIDFYKKTMKITYLVFLIKIGVNIRFLTFLKVQGLNFSLKLQAHLILF